MDRKPFRMNGHILDRKTACFEVEDNSSTEIDAIELIQGSHPRRPQDLAARLARQLLNQNKGILRDFGVLGSVDYDGTSVNIRFKASGQVGALPLLSPTSGRPDYGLIIKPRFGWQGLGPMLGSMGWKILPTPLKLPLLPRSDRKIPPWVISATILLRIKSLLALLERKFEFVEADLRAPRGQINWPRYAEAKMPRGNFLSLPCKFPDLRDDRELKAAIHFTLRKQLSSLQSQRSAGIVVLQLLSLCHSLISKVQDVPPLQPTQHRRNNWMWNNYTTDVFKEGIQAIDWTIDERGLAGLGDLQGLSWLLPMDIFFEAWVETVVSQLAKRAGGTVRSGRQRETVTPISWSPPYLGSQKYLLPDIILEKENETVIFDAKYKSHWEEINRDGWSGLEKELQERHRDDLLQVLAYSTVSESKRVVCCLAYPCRLQTWHSLLERDRPYHKASVRSGSRRVDLILTAIPMGVGPEEIYPVLARALTA